MPLYLKFLRWLTAASLIILLSLPVQLCISIYTRAGAQINQSTGEIFTREDVAEGLKPFGVALLVNAVLVITVCVIQRRYADAEKLSAMTPANRLRLAKKRVQNLPVEALREERQRRYITAAAVILAAICLCPGIIYMLRSENFVSWDMEAVMGGVMLNVLPGIAAMLCIMCAHSWLCDKSALREAEILRQYPVDETGVHDVKREFPLAPLRIVLYVAAAALIISGILNGGLRDVLVKAINICTECIGLG